jgi:hypothetical protein
LFALAALGVGSAALAQAPSTAPRGEFSEPGITRTAFHHGSHRGRHVRGRVTTGRGIDAYDAAPRSRIFNGDGGMSTPGGTYTLPSWIDR